MAHAPAKPLHVLLSEGASTSAREALTILGLTGHLVEVCDPDAHCLARFSRWVRRFHRCPGLAKDPAGFLAFIETLLARRRFDVLLPTHEQGYLLARAQQRLQADVGIALPDFANYRAAHSKAGFSRLLTELGLPQPATDLAKSAAELRGLVRFPCVIKTAIGTGSRGIWLVRDNAGLTQALEDLGAQDGFQDGFHDAFANGVLVQEFVAGAIEKAQAVFCRGKLLGFHAYRQIAAGAGGGDARKESVRRPDVRTHIAMIGARLGWHGALSVDYILSSAAAVPRYIDCNPRLVEPMSAYLAGLDLVQLLLQVSLGETPVTAADSRAGVRTHLAVQALLGCALRGGRRRDIWRECAHLLTRRGAYAGSVEELTPVRLDWMSAVPLAMTAIFLSVAPSLAKPLAKRGWGAHLLDAHSIRLIDHEDFGR
jgi:predicted ATP-grasp superfamily ATP-dependent carboligase